MGFIGHTYEYLTLSHVPWGKVPHMHPYTTLLVKDRLLRYLDRYFGNTSSRMPVLLTP